MTTRRTFLECLAGSAALAVCGCTAVGEFVEAGRRTARVGFLGNVVLSPKGDGRLRKALAYFRQAGVDAVAVVSWSNAGDSAACARGLLEAWDEAFGGTGARLVEGPGVHVVRGFRFAVSERSFSTLRDMPVFHADGRRALTEDAYFHQPGSLGYYVGSMSGVELPSGYYMGYEEPAEAGAGKKGPVRKGADVAEFESRLSKVCQGLLVDVLPEGTRIRRLDFTPDGPMDRKRAGILKRDGIVYAEPLAEDVFVGADEPAGAPAFWPGTSLAAIRSQIGYNPVVTLRWPTLLRLNSGVRAPFYEVKATAAGEPGRIVLRRFVPSRNYCSAECRDVSGTCCTFATEALGADGVEWRVTPISAGGVRGEPLTAR